MADSQLNFATPVCRESLEDVLPPQSTGDPWEKAPGLAKLRKQTDLSTGDSGEAATNSQSPPALATSPAATAD
jgi:hypothetical protein